MSWCSPTLALKGGPGWCERPAVPAGKPFRQAEAPQKRCPGGSHGPDLRHRRDYMSPHVSGLASRTTQLGLQGSNYPTPNEVCGTRASQTGRAGREKSRYHFGLVPKLATVHAHDVYAHAYVYVIYMLHVCTCASLLLLVATCVCKCGVLRMALPLTRPPSSATLAL